MQGGDSVDVFVDIIYVIAKVNLNFVMQNILFPLLSKKGENIFTEYPSQPIFVDGLFWSLCLLVCFPYWCFVLSAVLCFL